MPRCKSCNTPAKKKHGIGCSRRKENLGNRRLGTATFGAASITNPLPATQQVGEKRRLNKQPTKTLTNYIGLVVDESGSMGAHRDAVIKAFNLQLGIIKQKAHESGQKTWVDVTTFSNRAHARIGRAYHESIPDLHRDSFVPSGNTALYDAVGVAITKMRTYPAAEHEDTSFLLIVLTDGAENASSNYTQEGLISLIRKCQASDRWSFVFGVPESGKQILLQWGIPAGNISVWDGSREGFETYAQGMHLGTQAYYGARSKGATSVKSFFTPDLSKISLDTLSPMADLQRFFKRIKVPKEQEISELVSASGHPYYTGSTLYELTKPEDVQQHKELAILHRKSGKIYGGTVSRKIISMPEKGTVRVTPGNHGDWRIFVQSTSMNRKLVRGTEVLYKI